MAARSSFSGLKKEVDSLKTKVEGKFKSVIFVEKGESGALNIIVYGKQAFTGSEDDALTFLEPYAQGGSVIFWGEWNLED